MGDSRTSELQDYLARLQAGDCTARNDLLRVAGTRLTQLTHAMFKDYARLRRWEETGDVLQNALVRLCRALEAVTPPTVRDFYRLATLQIRRELIDLARRHYGPHGVGQRHESHPQNESENALPDSTVGPSQLAAWTEFHDKVQELPEEEREVFELIWYQALAHAEVAALLDVSTKTVKRRWQAACLHLHDALGGNLPGG